MTYLITDKKLSLRLSQGLAVSTLAGLTSLLGGCVATAPAPYYDYGYAPPPPPPLAAPGYYAPPPVVAPPVQIIAPIGVAPGAGWGWAYHPHRGWGWHHRRHGWRHHH